MVMSARVGTTIRAVPWLVVALITAAGCSSTAGPTNPGSSQEPASAPAAGTRADFTIRGYTIPALTAAAGATITVADGDDEPHTVTADDGSFDTGSFDKAAPGTLTAPKVPGTYPVHCTVHPSMHATLTVK